MTDKPYGYLVNDDGIIAFVNYTPLWEIISKTDTGFTAVFLDKVELKEIILSEEEIKKLYPSGNPFIVDTVHHVTFPNDEWLLKFAQNIMNMR
jgi:hypothetical protein